MRKAIVIISVSILCVLSLPAKGTFNCVVTVSHLGMNNNPSNISDESVGRIFTREDVRTVLHPFWCSRKKYLEKYQYNWRTRLRMEFQNKKCYFLTLTFDDEHLPSGSTTQQMKVCTDELQRFWKRLRDSCEYHGLGLHWKYFAVSENGEEHGRLHFHALLFADGTNTKVLHHRTAKPLFALIDQKWSNGRTQIRVADERHIRYITKYIFKRCFDPLYHSWKSNGIGLSYLTEPLCKYLREHLQDYIHLGGKVTYLPSYIRKKVFTELEREEMNDYLYQRMSEVPKDESFYKGYMMRDYGGELNPIPNYIGDKIVQMQLDNIELNNLLKSGGRL